MRRSGTFNYIDLATSQPAAFLRSATNPESGTVSYTYNSVGLVATKTDANGNVLTYSYDGYNRLYQVLQGAGVLRTYYYGANPFDGTFSHYALGRLAAVQYAPVLSGNGQFIDMYSYNIPGQVVTKRMQFNQTVQWRTSIPQTPVVEALNLDAGYGYDSEGAMTGISYPATVQASADFYPVRQSSPGPAYTYSLDTMHRATGMTDQSSAVVVSGVQYGAANELLSMSYAGISESRTYNSMFQMTAMTVGGQTTQYTFPAAGQNSGKISLRKDVQSGEEVQYSYDSLNRLIAASTTAASDAVTTPWGQGFGYDGFGNLTAKTVTKGSAPVMTLALNPLTNRITVPSYDANGNLLSLPLGGTAAYDAENRLVAVPGATYGYDGSNKRIWKWTGSVDGYGYGNASGLQLYLYGLDGKQLGTYVTSFYTNTAVAMAPVLLDSVGTLNVYFRGKKVGAGTPGALVAFKQDRLGSTVKTYPYGEEKVANGMDDWKFATYLRDTATNLDYADQRFYASGQGRFMSPDPYVASGGAADPASWNRFAYVQGDPVNYVDPKGTNLLMPGDGDDNGDYGYSELAPFLDQAASFMVEAEVSALTAAGLTRLIHFRSLLV